MTCKCGKGTVWFNHKTKKWEGCVCAKVKGQL